MGGADLPLEHPPGAQEAPRIARARRPALLDGLPEAVDASLARMAANLPDTLLFQLVTEIAPGEHGLTQGRILTFVGENAERVVGLSSSSLMRNGRAVFDLILPEDLARFAAAEAHALAEARPLRLDLRLVLPDGTPRTLDVSAAPTPLPPTRPGGIRLLWDGAATDVTAARADAAGRERMTEVVEAADDLIALVRQSGKVDYVNPAGRRMLGLSVDDAPPVASDLWQGGARGERMRHAIRTATREGAWRGESILRRPDGTELPVSQTLVAHRAPPAPGRRRGRVTHFSTIMRDASRAADTERALREAGERTSIELRENAHRVKNLFALVPAIISLSARTAEDVDGFAKAVRLRLDALSRANTLTLSTGKVELGALVRGVFDPYTGTAGALTTEGPKLDVSGTLATTIGLALHELVTNAVKYGAMSAPMGRVSLSWAIEANETLSLAWAESGGPAVSPPRRSGFGTSLIDRVVAAQGGTVERNWHPEGLSLRLVMPLR